MPRSRPAAGPIRSLTGAARKRVDQAVASGDHGVGARAPGAGTSCGSVVTVAAVIAGSLGVGFVLTPRKMSAVARSRDYATGNAAGDQRGVSR